MRVPMAAAAAGTALAVLIVPAAVAAAVVGLDVVSALRHEANQVQRTASRVVLWHSVAKTSPARQRPDLAAGIASARANRFHMLGGPLASRRGSA